MLFPMFVNIAQACKRLEQVIRENEMFVIAMRPSLSLREITDRHREKMLIELRHTYLLCPLQARKRISAEPIGQ